jgi:hypothetical protein
MNFHVGHSCYSSQTSSLHKRRNQSRGGMGEQEANPETACLRGYAIKRKPWGYLVEVEGGAWWVEGGGLPVSGFPFLLEKPFCFVLLCCYLLCYTLLLCFNIFGFNKPCFLCAFTIYFALFSLLGCRPGSMDPAVGEASRVFVGGPHSGLAWCPKPRLPCCCSNQSLLAMGCVGLGAVHHVAAWLLGTRLGTFPTWGPHWALGIADTHPNAAYAAIRRWRKAGQEESFYVCDLDFESTALHRHMEEKVPPLQLLLLTIHGHLSSSRFFVRSAITKWWSKKHSGVAQPGKKRSFISAEGCRHRP